MKIIYLAIPYSGIQESSYNQINKFLNYNIKTYKDLLFYSPITQTHVLAELGAGSTWDNWRGIDLAWVNRCDEVWVLIPDEGFEYVTNSIGVTAEINHANNNNKQVRFFKNVDDSYIDLII